LHKLLYVGWTVRKVENCEIAGQTAYLKPGADYETGAQGEDWFDLEGVKKFVTMAYGWIERHERTSPADEEKRSIADEEESVEQLAGKKASSKVAKTKTKTKSKMTLKAVAKSPKATVKTIKHSTPTERASRYPRMHKSASKEDKEEGKQDPFHNSLTLENSSANKEEDVNGFYNFQILWTYLLKDGWTYCNSSNPLEDWCYVSPAWSGLGSIGGTGRSSTKRLKGAILGKDYFIEECDLVAFAKRHNFKETYKNPNAESPKVNNLAQPESIAALVTPVQSTRKRR
jgi:hypothetical protein